jgi:hypothetical protein
MRRPLNKGRIDLAHDPRIFAERGCGGGLWNPHDSLKQISQPPVRKQQGAQGCIPKIYTYHKLFSFQWIRKQFRSKLFLIFLRFELPRNGLELLYWISGRSTSQVRFAQESFLYATFVTASTADAS